MACTIATVAAHGQQSESGKAIVQVEMSKVSRGGEHHIRVTPDSVNVLKYNRKASVNHPQSFGRTLSPAEWSTITALIAELEPEEIPNFVAPTFDRATDAAPHSTITLRNAEGEKYAHNFDGDNPHPRLKKLVNAILSLGNAR